MSRRDPQPLQKSMFSMPTLSGHEQLDDLVRMYGGAARVAADFHLAPELLRSYLAGVMEPPYTLLLSLYWQGPYGFSQALSEVHWINQANRARLEVAEARLAQYEGLLRHVEPMLGKTFHTMMKTFGISSLPSPVPVPVSSRIPIQISGQDV